MKYQWNSAKLQNKYKAYGNFMLVFMGSVLLSHFILHEYLKMMMVSYYIDMVLVVCAAVFWYLSYRTQNKDKELKKSTR